MQNSTDLSQSLCQALAAMQANTNEQRKAAETFLNQTISSQTPGVIENLFAIATDPQVSLRDFTNFS
jgi:hypothetical protein